MTRTHKLLLISSVALWLMAAGALEAATRVYVDAIARDLPAGTKVRVEMRSEYRIMNPCQPEGPPKKGLTEKYCSGGESLVTLPAQGTFVWEFEVPRDAKASAADYEFVFLSDLKKAPSKYSSSVSLPTKLRIQYPASAGGKVRTLDMPFGMSFREGERLYCCLRLKGPLEKLGMGIGKTCDAPFGKGLLVPGH